MCLLKVFVSFLFGDTSLYTAPCISVCTILFIAIVSGVSVIPLSDTKVNVSWTPVNLTVVDHYTVHYVYTTMGGVSVSVIFSSNTSSGVVSGLQGGQQYQFSVTVTLNVSGQLFKGLPQYTLPPITREHQSITSHHILCTKLSIHFFLVFFFCALNYSAFFAGINSIWCV